MFVFLSCFGCFVFSLSFLLHHLRKKHERNQIIAHSSFFSVSVNCMPILQTASSKCTQLDAILCNSARAYTHSHTVTHCSFHFSSISHDQMRKCKRYLASVLTRRALLFVLVSYYAQYVCIFSYCSSLFSSSSSFFLYIFSFSRRVHSNAFFMAPLIYVASCNYHCLFDLK